MSAETKQWLHDNVLVGNTDKYGKAWWADGTDATNAAGEANQYPGFIPLEDVTRRLFSWEATYEPIFRATMVGGFPVYEVDPDHQLVVHGDTRKVFNVVSPKHGIHQYQRELIDGVSAILDQAKEDLGIASAGLLDGGGTGWIQIEVSDAIEIGGDKFYPFICAYSSHTGKYATQFRVGVIRVVCDNTLAAFDGAGKVYKLRHTKNSKLNVAEARKVLEISFTHFDEFAREVDELQNTAVTNAQFDAIVAAIDPKPGDDAKPAKVTRWENRQTEIRRLYTADERVAPWAGTAWGVAQAFNTWATHYRTVRSSGGSVSRFDRNRDQFLAGKTSRDDRAVVRKVRQLVTAS